MPAENFYSFRSQHHSIKEFSAELRHVSGAWTIHLLDEHDPEDSGNAQEGKKRLRNVRTLPKPVPEVAPEP